jgi:Uma2 family endonuclease
MIVKAVETRMEYGEYLALEERSGSNHEYLRGEVLAMAGGTPEHAALASAVTIALGTALRGRPACACRSTSSMRTRSSSAEPPRAPARHSQTP